jgi:hypothetical protein
VASRGGKWPRGMVGWLVCQKKSVWKILSPKGQLRRRWDRKGLGGRTLPQVAFAKIGWHRWATEEMFSGVCGATAFWEEIVGKGAIRVEVSMLVNLME